jgi:uncharacterized membrane protein
VTKRLLNVPNSPEQKTFGTFLYYSTSNMQLRSDPVYISAFLLLLIVFSEWLSRKKFFSHIGSALIVIILAAIFANVHLIPSSQNPPALYDQIFKYVAPLGIFFLLLDVKLKNLRYAGVPMLVTFLLGASCTVIGAITSSYIVAPPTHHINYANAVAGMYSGTYIGGRANLNAIAIQYCVTKDGNLFAAINAVDNIITTLWIMATLVLPSILQKFFPRKRKIPSQNADLSHEELMQQIISKKEQVDVQGISILLFLGLATLLVSALISFYFPGIPSILTLTTIALVLAQIPAVQKIKGGKVLGYFLVLLFLAVIGAYCDIHALSQSGEIAATLLIWVTILVLIHAVLLFTIAGIFKQDWDIVSIASNANIGGTATAAVCANSLGRHDLQLPGILAGAVGNAIGTYAGIFVAEFLK